MNNLFWNDIQSDIFPWIKSFSRIIKSAAPPPINGDTLFISSDYSGDLSKSKYTVFSILLIDLSSIQEWESRRRFVRNKFLIENRRMSFKGLNDGYRQKALPYFLESADHLTGLHVNIVINKQINSLIYSNELYEKLSAMRFLSHNWNKYSFDKMATLTHFIALLISGLAKAKQNVYWYSDEDSLFANEKSSLDVSKMLGMFSGYYVKTVLGELGIGTTRLNESDFFEEDINAVSDLTAGCLSEFFDKAYNIVDKNSLRDFAYLFPKAITPKTENIITWLARSSETVKKVTIVFDRLNDSGNYKIWRFDTIPSPI